MEKYLEDVRFAVEHLMMAVWDEYSRVQQLGKEINQIDRIISHNIGRINMLMQSDDPDDIAEATGTFWDTYFNEDADRYDKGEQSNALRTSLQVKQTSIATLCGALLQMAKQGISSVNGRLVNSPPGRMVGSQHLRDVIVQARNQALHFEEGNLRPDIVRCFENLAKDFGSSFDAFTERSLAFEVINVLGWKSFDTFSSDMLQFSKCIGQIQSRSSTRRE